MESLGNLFNFIQWTRVCFFFFFKILFIYSLETDRVREAETQAEGEAGSMQGARCGTRSWDSRITPWAKGRRSTAEPPRDPHVCIFKNLIYLFIEAERERGRDTGRGRSRLHARSPMWDSILGLQDHTPGWRRHQTAAPPGLSHVCIFKCRCHFMLHLIHHFPRGAIPHHLV